MEQVACAKNVPYFWHIFINETSVFISCAVESGSINHSTSEGFILSLMGGPGNWIRMWGDKKDYFEAWFTLGRSELVEHYIRAFGHPWRTPGVSYYLGVRGKDSQEAGGTMPFSPVAEPFHRYHAWACVASDAKMGSVMKKRLVKWDRTVCKHRRKNGTERWPSIIFCQLWRQLWTHLWHFMARNLDWGKGHAGWGRSQSHIEF